MAELIDRAARRQDLSIEAAAVIKLASVAGARRAGRFSSRAVSATARRRGEQR